MDGPGLAGFPVGQVGDLQVVFIAYRGNAAFTVPAGWTKVEEENTGNTTEETTGSIASLCMAYRQLNSGHFPLPDNYTFTRTGGGVAIGRMYNFRGVATSSPIDASSSFTMGAAGTNVSPLPGVTTTQADELLVMMVALARNGEPTNFVATDPATLTRQDWFGTVTGANVDIGIAIGTRATAGATGNFSVTSASSARHAAAVIAIKGLLSVAIAPSAAAGGGSVVSPTVRQGSLILEPASSVAKGAVVTPTIVAGPIAVSPGVAVAKTEVVDPLVVFQSQTVAPVAVAARGDIVVPEVKGELIVSPLEASARGDTSVELVDIELGPLFFPDSPVSGIWVEEAPLT